MERTLISIFIVVSKNKTEQLLSWNICISGTHLNMNNKFSLAVHILLCAGHCLYRKAFSRTVFKMNAVSIPQNVF